MADVKITSTMPLVAVSANKAAVSGRVDTTLLTSYMQGNIDHRIMKVAVSRFFVDAAILNNATETGTAITKETLPLFFKEDFLLRQ
jgi:hypothetical protein